jgi:S-DNA-T family DNA segregation ATPase FtsK/SpoIIIE
MRDAAAAGALVAVTGGRAALAPRLTGHATMRLVLRLLDAGDYAQAGIDPRSAPHSAGPGRGVRAPDGAEFQIAQADESAAALRWRGVPSSAVRFRALPIRVRLDELPSRTGRCLLGVAGDAAAPIAVDLALGAGRLLVAGPARSGRSTLLCTVLRQSDVHRLVVAAPRRSPLTAAADAAGVPVLHPASRCDDVDDAGVLLVDDAEAFTDTCAGEALARWLRSDGPGRAAIVAGRSDALAVAFRGLGAELRRWGCGVLLQPGPVDGELLGVNLPRARPSVVPGRGVLVPDPAWGVGASALPLQVATP